MAAAIALVSAGCTCPTVPLAAFPGSVSASGQSVHDYSPPAGTTQMEVVVRWSEPQIQLRLMWIDPGCDPLTRDDCQRFSEPVGPLSIGPPTEIRNIATNQGPAAGPTMRFVVLNLSGRASTYTMTVAPHQAGCT